MTNVPADLFSSADFLDAAKSVGYGTLPIPTEKDQQITGLLRRWLSLDNGSRSVSALRISAGQQAVLLAYSERMASLAVRTGDEEILFFGLVAVGLDGWRYDWRENVALLSLHYDAAERIGLTPDQIFGRAGLLLSANARTELKKFVLRSAADRSLRAMGYKPAADNDGFRYRRTW